VGPPDDGIPFLEAAFRRRQVDDPDEGSPTAEPQPPIPDDLRDDTDVTQTRPVGEASDPDLGEASASVRTPPGDGISTVPASGGDAAASTAGSAPDGRDIPDWTADVAGTGDAADVAGTGAGPGGPRDRGADTAASGTTPSEPRPTPDGTGARSHLDTPDTTAGPTEGTLASALTRFDLALVDEAMKKSALIWVRTELRPGGRALWHSWLNGLAYVVTGGHEQPDPGLGAGSAVVVVRSKDTEDRLLAFRCEVSRMTAEDEDWAEATSDLAKTRLNLRNATEAPRQWQDLETYRVYRLRPTGDALVEGPGRYPDLSGRARPVETTATTSGAAPWIVHRPGGSGRPLS
jgi:hypothetical protein